MKLRDNLTIAFAAVATIWGIFFLDLILPIDLRMYGIMPRTLRGLIGIPLSPLLHVNLGHLIANSGALFVLLFLSLTYNRSLTLEALIIIIFLGGGLVWVFGAGHTVHIGASGVIFGLIGFLLLAGWFRRDFKALIISVVVFFLYGGVMFVGFIPRSHVSWTGHVFGFLAGVLAAWLSSLDKKENATTRS